MKSPNKYQRMLKLNLIKKGFESLEFKYFPTPDVYEVYFKEKLIYAVSASRNIQEIIYEIRKSRGF